ncbi:Inner membrane protein YrbG, predicted calcium/sodium:proton antiporter [Marinobacterium lacunae]|uniref:Inner membrane protein YrbG, predicted calcium/sodium:proton antiporter n=1 Tax=Marinobacterium lacunae TaxID=1232683 RepID=A0A081FX46_9GAMM|nr:calcium/sodium antiporter [Marinobacterium lacunae]KEA63101.1 Inner membrane protein YrbG, predicted calcium/sodium:proton antiporter [Marinobacterium lacunae]
MLLAILAVIAGLALLVWSADRFVDGAAATARHLGMPTLLIGMVIIGFGTSAPEMVVSALASAQGNPGLALGNGYGSNITNIALILGITALLCPIAVHSQILRKELPILAGVTLLSGYQLLDGHISRLDAAVLLLVFFATMGWSIWLGLKQRGDALGDDFAHELEDGLMPLKIALLWLVGGLILLVASSRILVWGAVEIATALGVSDLIIGLTVVAIGTSLPELASSIVAVRKNEHDLALGNVIGSNLFNTLAVIGIAGAIQPMAVEPEVLYRDWMVMAALTFSLFILGYGIRKAGHINRLEGGILTLVYASYAGYLVYTVVSTVTG